MINLGNYLSISEQLILSRYTEARFIMGHKFKHPEAFCVLEQNLIKNKGVVKKLLEDVEGMELFDLQPTFVPPKIIAFFKDTGAVPIEFNNASNTVTVGYLPENKPMFIEEPLFKIKSVPVTIYTYLNVYVTRYGNHPSLTVVPAREIFSILVQEALKLGASDITISSFEGLAECYYNVRKKKVMSSRFITAEDLIQMIKYMCGNNPYDFMSSIPKKLGLDLNDSYRGRAEINKKYKGYIVTIRTLPKAAFTASLESLNFTDKMTKFYREVFMNKKNGLRVIAGETSSGKNTVALSLLKEEIEKYDMKVVSVEYPVEQTLHGVEQIDCTTAEEYILNIQSLIRHNPDFVYVTEIGDDTGKSVLEVTNTDKRVLSTIHANRPSGVISRLADITGYSYTRIISSIHSIVYQRLIRDEEKDMLYPRAKFVYIDEDLRRKLLLASDDEKLVLLDDYEDGDGGDWT